ncbi:membrane protein [Beggiatoa sp. PS]|nr:membrane protein [Beggiatoa sp. PS]
MMLQFKMILLSRSTKEQLRTIPSRTGSWFRKFGNIFFDIVWQGIFILALVIAAMWYPVHWLTKPIPTQIQIDLITDHLSFRLTEEITLKQPIKFHEATLRYFDTLTFDPIAIVKQNPSSLNTLQIKATSDERFFPNIILKTTTPGLRHFGVLKQLDMAPNTKIVFSTQGAIHKELNITIENNQAQPLPQLAILQQSTPFQVTTRYCQLEGLQLPPNFKQDEDFTFEVKKLSRRNPMLQITGQPEQLKFALLVPNEQTHDMVPMGISITDLDFSWQDMIQGERTINYANIKSGIIRYPAYSTIAPVNFDPSNMIALGKTDTLQIEQMTLMPDNQGIKLRLSGLVKEPITTFLKVSPEISIDRRLTYSEVLPETSKFYKVMLDVILWFIPIIIGIIGIVAINIVKILPNQQQQQQSQ